MDERGEHLLRNLLVDPLLTSTLVADHDHVLHRPSTGTIIARVAGALTRSWYQMAGPCDVE
jgi:hypothetical protein